MGKVKILVWFVVLLVLMSAQTALSAPVLTFDNPSDADFNQTDGWWFPGSATVDGNWWFGGFGQSGSSMMMIDNGSFAPNNVLRITDDPSKTQAVSPLNYSALTHNTLTGPTTSITFDFYVDWYDWLDQSVYSGIWASDHGTASQLLATAPKLVYRQSRTNAFASGFYDYDVTTGNYNFIGSGVDVYNLGVPSGWNSLEMRLEPGVGIDYFLNGVKSGFTADTTTQYFDSFSLVTSNYAGGSLLEQNIFYDNIGSGVAGNSAPEPSSLLLIFPMLVWLGIRRSPVTR